MTSHELSVATDNIAYLMKLLCFLLPRNKLAWISDDYFESFLLSQ